MINQPTNVIPSMFAGFGDGVVSAASPVKITWQVNGNSPMTHFKINVYQNDSNSTLVYTTGKTSCITDEYPDGFYGKDEKGEPIYFVYPDTIGDSGVSWATWGLSDGNEYKLQITQYWNGGNDSVTQYAESAFITRTAPTLTMGTIPATVAAVTQNFTATYTQAQNDSLNWVRWQFALVDGAELIPLDDTGEINTGVLKYSYDGLLNGNEYAVNCIVCTQNGVQISTGWQTFSVEYTESEAQGEFTVKCGDGFAYVSWGAPVNIPATDATDYSFFSGYLLLTAGQYVKWDEVDGEAMAFASDWCFGVRMSTLNIGIGAITKITLGADMEIIVIMTVVNGQKVIEVTGASGNIVVPESAGFLDLFILPEKICAYFYYNSALEYISTAEVARSAALPTITSIRINGAQQTEWVYLTKNLNIQPNMTPAWNYMTLFLTSFAQNTLQGGTYGGEGTLANSFYRGQTDGNDFRKLVDVPTAVVEMKDYSVRAQTPYFYEMFYKQSQYSAPIRSESVCQKTNGYYLIEASEDANGVYHAINVWKFGNNLSSTAITNNNNPNFLSTFTPYRLRQQSSRMGKSGTLTALISNFSHGVYSDSVEMMNSLYALSQSTNALFLKDKKGNLYMVAVSGAISQTINTKSRLQEVMISLPWEEVGDASDAVIIQLPTDEGWQA